MSIKKVWLDESEDECIACGSCESTCPEVFHVKEKMAVKKDVDFNEYESCILEAVESCPAGVIKYK